ncbi:MAG: hypothetical protein PHE81_00795 [Atribacterota bacterium]|jgi:hypothetical protein|nr:hypothetical protein [Atribacterota bacterium]MDD3032050.1 hypothetical protein [Atribacterota bacterium]MDD3641451.1 hypothetical protein [Atribacterota bacterium]MDD4289514.1 hypothetical protein [Atribacterota bacterium]MDD4765034.1 hypothetical protein [Atribacterota bacterium]
MAKRKKLKNIFADKASIVLRIMLQNPEKKWVVRDFSSRTLLSIGMAQEVLQSMEIKGYIERVKKGPKSFTVLTNPEKLITDWIKWYQFEKNGVESYYSPDKNILKKIKSVLKEQEYALTLHPGANLITSFVRTTDIYLYIKTKSWKKDILKIRQDLGLKELVQGGNIHFVDPFYRNSIFNEIQKIGGYSVASNLQLYLDLYNFQPRGREHAEYLKNLLLTKGVELA